MTIGPAGGPHLVIHDGTKLAVAVLKPATPAVGATFTDTRAWIGVKATDVGASLEGIDGLVLSITGGTFSYNSASGAHDDNGATAGGTITNATALTWATALGTAPTVGTQTIDLDGELLSLAGTAQIDVFGFFTRPVHLHRRHQHGQRDRRHGRRRELVDGCAAHDALVGARMGRM